VSKKVPREYVLYRLCEKFGWTEEEILNSSFLFISSMLKIMRIESDYLRWKNKKKYGNR
jgi:hypothetical protein